MTGFSTGQDVRLTAKHAQAAKAAGLAVAGTVTGTEPKKDGTVTYAVRFPGQAGTRHGLTVGVLEATESPAVRPRGGGPFTIRQAEEILIGISSGTSADREAEAAVWRNLRTSRAELLTALADACGMALPDLIRQLAPRISRRRRERKRALAVTGP